LLLYNLLSMHLPSIFQAVSWASFVINELTNVSNYFWSLRTPFENVRKSGVKGFLPRKIQPSMIPMHWIFKELVMALT
jgi:hypothetical protein